MLASFTFDGFDIETIGLHYVPELSDTYVYKPSETETHIETYDGHNGGYYYGAWKRPKEFILRCFFENKRIDAGILSKLYGIFKVGKSGKLVFSRRPWCYYTVVITKVPELDLTNYENGLVTITATATHPFAKSNIMSISRTEKSYDNILENTAVVESATMIPTKEFDMTTAQTVFLLNPGTEKAPVRIHISGNVGDGIVITNRTNGEVCKIIGGTLSGTLIIDSETGKVLKTLNNATSFSFKNHQYGFINLEPGYPCVRNLHIKNITDLTLNTYNTLDIEDVDDKYIFINKWHKINSHERTSIVLNGSETLTAAEQAKTDFKTMAVSLNEIYISPLSTMNIHIKFDYDATYA